LLQVERQKGHATREVVARKTLTKGTCITLPKILVGFVPKKKEVKGAVVAFPCFALKQTTWGVRCVLNMNITKYKGSCCPPTSTIVR
jgi:hypothetical protein